MNITITVESGRTSSDFDFASADEALNFLDSTYPNRHFSHTERVIEGTQRVWRAEGVNDDTRVYLLIPKCPNTGRYRRMNGRAKRWFPRH